MAALTPTFRVAVGDDLPVLVAMLADDALGATRETPGAKASANYALAYEAIENDPNNCLVVAEVEGQIVGFLQLTFIPYLTYEGGKRATIESVRVRSELRGRGLGEAMIEQAVSLARLEGCHLVQLTTDKRRPDAIKFYERLGFNPTHEGMKLHLK